MVLDGLFEHDHSEPDERSIQRHTIKLPPPRGEQGQHIYFAYLKMCVNVNFYLSANVVPFARKSYMYANVNSKNVRKRVFTV